MMFGAVTANNRNGEIDQCGGNEDDVWCSGLLRVAKRESCWQKCDSFSEAKKSDNGDVPLLVSGFRRKKNVDDQRQPGTYRFAGMKFYETVRKKLNVSLASIHGYQH